MDDLGYFWKFAYLDNHVRLDPNDSNHYHHPKNYKMQSKLSVLLVFLSLKEQEKRLVLFVITWQETSWKAVRRRHRDKPRTRKFVFMAEISITRAKKDTNLKAWRSKYMAMDTFLK